MLKELFGFSIYDYIKAILALILTWTILALGAVAEAYYPEIIYSL
ncbi:MAG: hypothetical protein R3214_04920 [Christiangramia sp.]|nr:hypothetical protein [Christiangramia sp.]